jgi:hypothetical protein
MPCCRTLSFSNCHRAQVEPEVITGRRALESPRKNRRDVVDLVGADGGERRRKGQDQDGGEREPFHKSSSVVDCEIHSIPVA